MVWILKNYASHAKAKFNKHIVMSQQQPRSKIAWSHENSIIRFWDAFILLSFEAETTNISPQYQLSILLSIHPLQHWFFLLFLCQCHCSEVRFHCYFELNFPDDKHFWWWKYFSCGDLSSACHLWERILHIFEGGSDVCILSGFSVLISWISNLCQIFSPSLYRVILF